MLAHGASSAAPTRPNARPAGCKHTVALVTEELGPVYTSRAAEVAMEHACFRAVWMYRPTCTYMVGPLSTKLLLAIQQKRTPELTCAALGYCGLTGSGSGPALANNTSNNNISITINVNHNELAAPLPAVRPPPTLTTGGTHEHPQRPRLNSTLHAMLAPLSLLT